MKKLPAVSGVSSPTFTKGQVWKIGDRWIQIGHVGKRLVEHRGMRPEHKRAISSMRMGTIKELQTLFKANHAVLIVN